MILIEITYITLTSVDENGCDTCIHLLQRACFQKSFLTRSRGPYYLPVFKIDWGRRKMLNGPHASQLFDMAVVDSNYDRYSNYDPTIH